MKYLIQILFFTFPIFFYGQKWDLVEIDESNEYSYNYIFSFQNIEDENSYSIVLIDQKKSTSIEITDNEGKPVMTVLSITNTKTNEVHNFVTDVDGKLDMNLDFGFYKLEIKNPFFDDAEMQFRVGEDAQLDIFISLGKAPEIEVYGIESKHELEEVEILKIIACVNKNRNTFYESCSDMKSYRVHMKL